MTFSVNYKAVTGDPPFGGQQMVSKKNNT